MNNILVTGATGAVGSALVADLAQQGYSVRALVRDPRRAHLGDRVEVAVGDYNDPESVKRALDGMDSVFLSCGNIPEQVGYECAVIDAAANSGIQRIVKLSARGAAIDAPVAYWHWHALIEQHLAASNVAAVVLQPGFLMTNLLGAAEQVRQQGMIFAPAAQSRIAMQQERGLEVRWLTGPEFDELNPAVAPGRTLGSSYAPGDGYIDAPRNVLAYTAALVNGGVDVRGAWRSPVCARSAAASSAWRRARVTCRPTGSC